MRDGVRLFTAIYEPKDKSTKHPILVERSPYTCYPYGEEFGRYMWESMSIYSQHNYIMVFQDVRGKNHSEGDFVEIRPLANKQHTNAHQPSTNIDEATDTYDTVDWLIKNCKGNNGAVGFWGISYPGFYSTMAGICGHPAVKAVSPQAPVTNWFLGDDMHHNGAFMLMDTYSFYPWFSRHDIMQPYDKSRLILSGGDAYTQYLHAGAISNLTSRIDSVPMWFDTCNHPDYDEWWQERDAIKAILSAKNKKLPAVMVVGGEFDAEDMWGAIHTYHAFNDKMQAANTQHPTPNCHFVYGPWSHGGWTDPNGMSMGDIVFGDSICRKTYRSNIEYPFFAYYLEGKGMKPASVRTFSTGENTWRSHESWPLASPEKGNMTNWYLLNDGTIDAMPQECQETITHSSLNIPHYTSDPKRPVPYQSQQSAERGTTYLCADQRFAAQRPDVLVYQTDTLRDTLRLAGPVIADMDVSITTTDADFVVKLIDVYPDNFKYSKHDIQTLALSQSRDTAHWEGPLMGGYQMLVRGDVMRGRYRNSFSKPEPFKPGEITKVRFELNDVCHTFLPGHRLMIQIQSSWFPLVDMNPQQFVNIYKCKDEDFIPTTVTIHSAHIELPIVK